MTTINPNLKTYNAFTDFLITKMENLNITDSDIRKEISLDPRTWKKRKQTPQDLSVKNIQRLASLLETSPDDILHIIIKSNT